jgi:membrane protease YdiL (CAAX protease family)
VKKHDAVLLAGLVLLAQVVAITGGSLPGAFMHAAAFLAILNVAIATVDRDRRALLQALAVIPLVQLVALTVFPPDLDLSIRYLLVTLPTFVAVVVAAREARIAPRDLGLRIKPFDVALALVMLPGCISLGLFAYDLVKPLPLVGDPTEPDDLLVPMTALVVGALVEAALFRGLLHTSAVRVFGLWRGMAFASILFAAVSVVGTSPAVLLLGLYSTFMFGFATIATGSIYPAAAGQVTLNASMFIVGPFQGG